MYEQYWLTSLDSYTISRLRRCSYPPASTDSKARLPNSHGISLDLIP